MLITFLEMRSHNTIFRPIFPFIKNQCVNTKVECLLSNGNIGWCPTSIPVSDEYGTTRMVKEIYNCIRIE